MPIPGKLEVTIKIHELPTEVTTKSSNGWKEFTLDCGGRPVIITVRPRMWLKLEEAQKTYPLWVASITGQHRVIAGEDALFQSVSPNSAGLVRTVNASGRLDLNNAFFQDLGTNVSEQLSAAIAGQQSVAATLSQAQLYAQAVGDSYRRT